MVEYFNSRIDEVDGSICTTRTNTAGQNVFKPWFGPLIHHSFSNHFPKISDDSSNHQSLLPCVDLSSRCSNLSRAPSPKHASESAGFCSGCRFPVLRESALLLMLFIYSKAADSLHSKAQSPIDVNCATRDKTFLKDLATLNWKISRFHRRIALFPGMAMSSCSPNAANRQGGQEVEWRAYRSLPLSSVA